MSYRQAIKSVSVLWLSLIGSAVLAFLIQVILARQLGPFSFGEFSAALATVTLLCPLAGFGVSGFWLITFGKEGWLANRWLPASFRYIFISTFIVIATLTLWGLYGPHDTQSQQLHLILIVCVLGQLVIGLVSAKLQLEERFNTLALWLTMQNALRLALVGFLVLSVLVEVSARLVAYSYAVAALIMSAFAAEPLFRLYQGKFDLKGHDVVREATPAFPSTGRSPKLRQVAGRSWPFGVDNFYFLMLYQGEVILLKYLDSAESAAFYNVAALIILAVYQLPVAIYQKFMRPRLYRMVYQDFTGFLDIYSLGWKFMVILGVLCMVGLYFVGAWFIQLMFGDKYSAAIVILYILCLSIPVRFAAIAAETALEAKGYIKKKLGYLSLVTACSIWANFLVIPEFGAIGAATVSVFGHLLILILYVYSVHKNIFKGGQVASITTA